MLRQNLSLQPVERLPGRYPRQYWILMLGVLIEITVYSMVWPFLTIYQRSRMEIPLATVALLFTANSVASVVSTAVTGPVLDYIGRKKAMIAGLTAMSTILMAMSVVGSVTAWFTLMARHGRKSSMPIQPQISTRL